jgi:xanthine dehydrogenase large subunit
MLMTEARKLRDYQGTVVHKALFHDSAAKHVSGSAIYVDDIPEPPGTLHAAFVLSPFAHARVQRIDVAKARRSPGVVAIVTAQDIPGENDIAPLASGEPLFADKLIEYSGQPLAVIAARNQDEARAAAKVVDLDIEPLEPVLTISQAMERKSFLVPPMTIERGEVSRALATAPEKAQGTISIGGQEHFYLEGQVAVAVPEEDRVLTIYSATQNPTEVQHICSRLLGVPFNKIITVVRRLGGGFGGKESNASWIAGAAALLAWKTAKPVKLRLPRETDMLVTGKRHGFLIKYEVGFDHHGRILAFDVEMAANGGHSTDHTPSVLTKALTHVDNCYYIPNFRAIGYSCKTNTVSNTAFRGYGAPQAVVVMEDVIEQVANRLSKTPEEIRAINFYRAPACDEAPYGQKITDNLIERCVAQVKCDGQWDKRRREVDAFNRMNASIKRGLGLFPLKFGISFPAQYLNQASALVHVYADGSIRLNHGGTEMGQGLFIKVAQVVAEVFQVNVDRISLSATSTAEVPNTSPTAASTGSDLNGWAAHNAGETIKKRMIAFAADKFETPKEQITFRDDQVQIGVRGSNRILSFGELAKLCWLARVPLSATGFYKTPRIEWDQTTMRGRPFFYYSYGAAIAEVAVDLLTGEVRVRRVDIVQDCGRSLNPIIDLGQIEGGFVQGMGWHLCEELWWDREGRLRTIGPSTYKIPGSRDVPPTLNVRMLEDVPARVPTIFRSKGIGEPPLLLATAIRTAVKDAIGGIAGNRVPVSLDLPATPERILMLIERLKVEDAAGGQRPKTPA